MDFPPRTTTIQITLLNESTPPFLRGRIRLAGGVTVPFVGARDLVIQLRALLADRANYPSTPPRMESVQSLILHESGSSEAA